MKIVVYGKPECVQCDYTKVWLTRKELTYEYIDITQDKDAARDALKIIKDNNLNLTWPLVIASNNHRAEKWTGFKLDRIKGLRETGDY